MKNQIVIVEDDKEIREGVEIYLRREWEGGLSNY